MGSMDCWVWDTRENEMEKQLEKIRMIVCNSYSGNLTFDKYFEKYL